MFDIEGFLIGAFFAVLVVMGINFAYFFNWMSVFNFLLKIIAPHKKIDEIDRELVLYKNKQFKAHLRKWKVVFLLNAVIFVGTFFIALLILKVMFGSWLIGLICMTIGFGVLENKEVKARKELISLINKNNVSREPSP